MYIYNIGHTAVSHTIIIVTDLFCIVTFVFVRSEKTCHGKEIQNAILFQDVTVFFYALFKLNNQTNSISISTENITTVNLIKQ